MSDQFLLFLCFIEIPVINANSVDPDQMPHSMASDLGLHCLPMSLFWDTRHKWVKCYRGEEDTDGSYNKISFS